jgi:hypothetical protein
VPNRAYIRNLYTPSYYTDQEEARGPILYHVSCVFSVVLMGRETGTLQLLAPLLLMGGKGADLVIRGNIVLNKYNNYGTMYSYCKMFEKKL